MSWQNIKRLQEERAQHLAAMKAILNTAETEKRDLSDSESKTFDELNGKAEKAAAECQRYEKMSALEKLHKDNLEQRREQPGRDDLDTPEKRAEALKLEQRKQMDMFLRNGVGAIQNLETRALTISGVGGVVGDRPFYQDLVLGMKYYAGVRQAGATILPTSDGNELGVPKMDDTSNTGQIVAEGIEDDTSADAVPAFVKLVPTKFDSKWIKLSTELIQDSAFPVEATILAQASERIGRSLNIYTTTGTGTGQPQGFVTAAGTGVTAASTTAVTYDEVVNFIHSLDAAYRNTGKAVVQMHDQTLAFIRRLKDGVGHYIWAPGEAGAPNSILGYNYVVNNNMAQLSAGANSAVMAFGDFSRYFVRDVTAPYIVRADELFIASGLIGYRVFSRHDGKLVDTNAVKLLMTASS